jgi:hypothetical protein
MRYLKIIMSWIDKLNKISTPCGTQTIIFFALIYTAGGTHSSQGCFHYFKYFLLSPKNTLSIRRQEN